MQNTRSRLEKRLAQLLAAGWTVPEIAEHTRMTDYTTARIADRVAERVA